MAVRDGRESETEAKVVLQNLVALISDVPTATLMSAAAGVKSPQIMNRERNEAAAGEGRDEGWSRGNLRDESGYKACG